jgi:hypothetical protein
LRLKDQAPYALPRGAFLQMTLKIAGAGVKASSRSSTARPQEKVRRHTRESGYPVRRSVAIDDQRSGILDHPPSRMMTMVLAAKSAAQTP